jgi:hypothetical protein
MSELDITVEERLEASIAEVWRFIVEGYFDNHSAWDPAIVNMEKLTSGPVGLGTRGKETRKALGRQTTEFEVTTYDLHARFGLRNTSGPFDLEREYRLAEEGTGTLLRFHFRMKPRGSMKMLFPLLRTTIEKQVRTNAASLPALLRC